LVHLKANEALHLGHERAEVVRFFATDVGEALKEDVEVLFAFIVGWGSVARGAFENIREAASDVVKLLFLWLTIDEYMSCNELDIRVKHLPCRCHVSPTPPTLRWQ